MNQDNVRKFRNCIDLALFSVIGILLLLRQCDTPKTREVFLKGKETIKYDTIPNTDTLVEFKKVFYPKWDTIIKADTTWDASLCLFERTYNDSLVDSNITIYSKVQTIGLLKSSKTSYKWKKPEIIKNISRIDTLVKPNKFQLFVNSELGGNLEQINMYPGITVLYKKIELGYSYGLLDKTHNIRVGYRLFKSKN